MFLNLDQNNIVQSNNEILFSLAKAHETTLGVSRQKIILWDEKSHLKRLIKERKKQVRNKNGKENTKQLTKKIKNKLVNVL